MEEMSKLSGILIELKYLTNSLSDKINFAIYESLGVINLNIKGVPFELGVNEMPSSMYSGKGTFNTVIINDTGITALLILESGGVVFPHIHNDATETVIVTKGLVRETVSNTLIQAGQSFKINAGIPHGFEVLEDTSMIAVLLITED